MSVSRGDIVVEDDHQRDDKDGWRKVFQGRLPVLCVRDVYQLDAKPPARAALFRHLYARFLVRGGKRIDRPGRAEGMGQPPIASWGTWTELANPRAE